MSTVIVEKQGGVATIRMNRPDRMNVYDFEMGKELLDAVSILGTDPGVRCIEFTGAGRAFSAGGDVALMGSFRAEAAESFLDPSPLCLPSLACQTAGAILIVVK